MIEKPLTKTAETAVTNLNQEAPRPARNRTLKRFLKHRIAIVAVIILGIIAFISLLAPVFARYDYDQIDLRASGESISSAHWFGTDRVGRDIWSRTLYGGRVSLAVGIGATLISTTIGTILACGSSACPMVLP